jgi:hypothetical protein
MHAFMTVVYFGQAADEDPGVGLYNVECLLCDEAVESDVKATVPAIAARARAHARQTHGISDVPVAIRAGQ